VVQQPLPERKLLLLLLLLLVLGVLFVLSSPSHSISVNGPHWYRIVPSQSNLRSRKQRTDHTDL